MNDSYPPNKNKLRAEYLAAQVTSRFLGYLGLYENGELVVVSNEPMLAAKRRPSGNYAFLTHLLSLNHGFFIFIYYIIKLIIYDELAECSEFINQNISGNER